MKRKGYLLATLLAAVACRDAGTATPSDDTTTTAGSSDDTTIGAADGSSGDPADETTTGAALDPCASATLAPAAGCACEASTCVAGQWCDLVAGACIDPSCGEAEPWAPGTPAFQEITVGSGLLDLAVEGTRLSVVDFDGDGWADLFVRRGGVVADVPGTARHAWLLRNLQGKGFEDVTASSGVLARRDGDTTRGRPVEIVAAADVDNDGDVDLYTGIANTVDAAEGETSEIMLNQGDGTYALGPVDSDLRRVGELDVPAGASFVDANRDGNIDVWIPQNEAGGVGVQDRLYYGDGSGTFFDGTSVSDLGTEAWADIESLNAGLAHTRAWSAASCDLNGDGWPELLASSYGRSPNHLWQGVAGDDFPTFVNRSVASGYAYDGNQMWQDNQFAACYCSGNPDAEDCGEAVSPQISCTQPNWNHGQDREPFRLGGNSGATVCADLDNDGALDLWTSEIRHWWAGEGADHSEALFNLGDADVAFERPGRAAMGIDVPHVTGNSWDEGHMSANVFDFDNDGWADIYVGASDYPGNRGLLFHQDAPREFSLVSIEDGFNHNRSHGVATADFDHDGDVDLVVGHSTARCDAAEPNDCYPTQQIRMFDNIAGDAGHWIALELVGAGDINGMAVGARVTIDRGELVQVQEVGGGFGHFGAQNDRALHFGLGDDCTAKLTIRWPDADLTEHTLELPAGHRYRVTSDGAVTLVQ